MHIRFEIIFRLSFNWHVTSREPRNGFALNLLLKNCTKICRHVSILAKLGKIMAALHRDLHEFLLASRIYLSNF
jgi:hypothetical protein